MRILITGITGQDGYYLAQEALRWDHEVFGLIRGQNNPKEAEIEHDLPAVHRLHGDLTDAHSVEAAVITASPDAIFNMAAMTFIPTSWQQPTLALRTITEGTLNVLNAALRVPGCRVIQASTSEMFGNAPVPRYPAYMDAAESQRPGWRGFNEKAPMMPASPYGTAKLAAHHLCRNYRDFYGLVTTTAIMFNHESPRRPPIFVTRKITKAIAEIVANKRTTLELGNIDAARDWGWAPDYMLGLLKIAEAPDPAYSYVIATGKTATVGEFLTYASRLARVNPDAFMVFSEADARRSELWKLQGDASKITAELGWHPEKDWQDVAAYLLAHDYGENGLSPGDILLAHAHATGRNWVDRTL